MGKIFVFFIIFGILVVFILIFMFYDVFVFIVDVFFVIVFGGIIFGIGIGFVICYGGVFDGMEIFVILISKKILFFVGEIVMFFNFFILGVVGFVFMWDCVMYFIFVYIIVVKVIDMVVEGLEELKLVWIISDYFDDIGDVINVCLGWGVIYLYGEGVYMGDDKKVIFCIIMCFEELKLKIIVEDFDFIVFLVVVDIIEVCGGCFKKWNIY